MRFVLEIPSAAFKVEVAVPFTDDFVLVFAVAVVVAAVVVEVVEEVTVEAATLLELAAAPAVMVTGKAPRPLV